MIVVLVVVIDVLILGDDVCTARRLSQNIIIRQLMTAA